MIARFRPLVKRLDDALDQHIFPAVVRYATHRVHILFLVFLWLALLVGGSWTLLALTGGNYFNGLCGIVSCVLLAQQLSHHRENSRRHDEHSARLSRIEAHMRLTSTAAPKAPPKPKGW